MFLSPVVGAGVLLSLASCARSPHAICIVRPGGDFVLSAREDGMFATIRKPDAH